MANVTFTSEGNDFGKSHIKLVTRRLCNMYITFLYLLLLLNGASFAGLFFNFIFEAAPIIILWIACVSQLACRAGAYSMYRRGVIAHLEKAFRT
jgi:hypothetical protein